MLAMTVMIAPIMSEQLAVAEEQKWKVQTVLSSSEFGGDELITSRDDTELVATGDAGAAIWNIREDRVVARLPHERCLNAVFSQNEAIIVTCSKNDVKLWDAPTGKPRKEYPGYRFARFAANGTVFAAAVEKEVHVVNVDTGRTVATIPSEVSPHGLAVAHDGKTVLTLGADRRLKNVDNWSLATWDAMTGREIGSGVDGFGLEQLFLWLPERSIAIIGRDNRTVTSGPLVIHDVIVYDHMGCRAIAKLSASSAWTYPPVFSRDRKTLALHDRDRDLIELRRVDDGQKISELKVRQPVCVAFSPDELSIAVGSGYGGRTSEPKLDIWQIQTGEKELSVAVPGGVGGIAFLRNSRSVAASTGRRITIWTRD